MAHRKEKLLENTTQGGRSRWKVYLGVAVVLAGIAIATLISLGMLSQDDVEAWIMQVVVTVTALVGLIGTLLAMFHPEKKRPQDLNVAPQVPNESDPKLGGHPKN